MSQKYISRISAARLQNIPYIDTILETAPLIDSTAKPLLHQTVSSLKERNRTKKMNEEIIFHVITKPLPSGAVVKHKGIWISSPELVFMELAGELSFHRTLLLGLSICGYPAGHPEKALANTKKIQKLLEKTRWHSGNVKASKAAKYLADGSASIIESFVFLLLTLPHHYGGYGLKGAEFNHKISLEGKDTALKKKYVYADLYWKQAKLIVEYDSKQYHDNTNSWVNDAIRLAALRKLGYTVISINTAQLYNTEAFREQAYVIAQCLKKRIRIRDAGFLKAQEELRSILPEN